MVGFRDLVGVGIAPVSKRTVLLKPNQICQLYLEALHAKKQFLVHIYQYFDGSFSNKKCVQLF